MTREGRRLRVAGGLIVLGLLVQATSLLGVGPGPFLTFILVGATSVGAGVALFLWRFRSERGSRAKR